MGKWTARAKALVRWAWLRLTERVPQRLPQTGEAFEQMTGRLLADYGIKDDPSYRQAIAMAVLSFKSEAERIAPRRLIHVLRSRIAYQVAYEATRPPKDPEPVPAEPGPDPAVEG